MSILIKGMEMPKNCFLCSLSILNGERLFCEVTHDEVIRAKRATDCPLIEVPEHGKWSDKQLINPYNNHPICPYCGSDLQGVIKDDG